MDDNHKLGLFVAYYLSRFNKSAYDDLGFGTQAQTHTRIGEILNVNPHTVKNWRDEFDPIHGFRAGWHQRPMSPSRVEVVEALENLEETGISAIVTDILNGNAFNDSSEKEKLLSIISLERDAVKAEFTSRGVTGKNAEEFFIDYHSKNDLPFKGILTDTRYDGCGYDFVIDTGRDNIYIEVKGLAEANGGVLFTDKEWFTAKELGDSFYLAIVKNVGNNPTIKFLKNPYSLLNPTKNIYTVVQVQWVVGDKELNKNI